PQVVSAAKLPILNPNEFDLWKMRIEQYFLMTDYSLWEVILNGDYPAPTKVIEGVVQLVVPTTTEQRCQDFDGGNREKVCRNKLKVSKLRRLKKVGTSQRVDTSDDTVMDDVSKQERIIADMDADVVVTLKDVADIAKEVAADAEIKESADVQGR
nr:DUF4219 domain-containing protein/UBN2 domain-containing protein [Tanacetum cinerariifolium]